MIAAGCRNGMYRESPPSCVIKKVEKSSEMTGMNNEGYYIDVQFAEQF
jgi:hypothetical protein